MQQRKQGKPFQVMSTNPKMDTSGMAGKPKPLGIYVWTPPPMDIGDMLEEVEKKTSKKPELED